MFPKTWEFVLCQSSKERRTALHGEKFGFNRNVVVSKIKRRQREKQALVGEWAIKAKNTVA